jgi:hypothetical protein
MTVLSVPGRSSLALYRGTVTLRLAIGGALAGIPHISGVSSLQWAGITET